MLSRTALRSRSNASDLRPKHRSLIRKRANPTWRSLATRVARDGAAPRLQAKLKVGPVDDPLEREADRVADRVLRMPEEEETLQRQPMEEEEETLQLQPIEEEEEELQAKPESGAPSVSAGTAGSIRSLGGGGRPLPAATRAYFEPRLAADLSGVRIHTGSPAQESARAVRARAFTLGSDIAFASGEYRPQTHSGRRLLAHELTHVVQQGGGAAGSAGILWRKKNPLEGYKAAQLVDHRAEAKIDAALAQSRLAPFIREKIKQGTRIKGGVTYLNRKAFEEAYVAHTRRRVGASKPEDVGGFYDPKKDRIFVRNPPKLEALLHEAIHKFADSSFRKTAFGSGLDEGVTQHFTNLVLDDFGLGKGSAYPQEVIAGEALADVLGLDSLAKGYFSGPAVELLKTLQTKLGADFAPFIQARSEDPPDWKKVAAILRRGGGAQKAGGTP